MFYQNPQIHCLCCATLLATFFGCGPGVPKIGTIPASGTVTFKGQPVEGANVAFVPADPNSGKQATGYTDGNGRFKLQTFFGGTSAADGALPGDYQVTVVKVSGSGSGLPTLGEGGGPGTTLGGPNATPDNNSKLELPSKYADPAKSGLTATVKPAGNEPFALTLTDE